MAGGSTGSIADSTTTHEGGLFDFPLCLQPQRFLLPHYADTPKVGYAVQGSCVVGVCLPGEAGERVVQFREGDFLIVPTGVVTWYYNDGDSPCDIVFLGDASAGLQKGFATYFILAGPFAAYNGFTSELLAAAFGTSVDAAGRLFKSQPIPEVLEIARGRLRVEPRDADREGIFLSVASAHAAGSDAAGSDAAVKGGGCVARMAITGPGAPATFSVDFTRLEPGAVRVPGYYDAVQLVHVTRGGGRIQISGIYGKNEYDEVVTAGSIFVVKKFYAMAAVAGDKGLEWFSIVQDERAAFYALVGKTSPLSRISPQILEISLNQSLDSVKIAAED